MTNLYKVFHVVVSVDRFVRIWNLPQFPAKFWNGLFYLRVENWGCQSYMKFRQLRSEPKDNLSPDRHQPEALFSCLWHIFTTHQFLGTLSFYHVQLDVVDIHVKWITPAKQEEAKFLTFIPQTYQSSKPKSSLMLVSDSRQSKQSYPQVRQLLFMFLFTAVDSCFHSFPPSSYGN